MITEEEILAIVHLGAKEGEISQQESLMIHNIIGLEEKKVRTIMTPRTVMFILDANMSIGEALPLVNEKGLTRIPIYEGDREHIIGYVMRPELSSTQFVKQLHILLKSLAKPITFVPETTNCLTLLTNFLKQRQHIAIVLDEYGGVAGLVTLEDLLETVLGAEIVDEKDQVVDLRENARQRWLRRKVWR
jgi:CBS domain containing-hemolysin-like protein